MIEMDNVIIWGIILGGMLATYATRLSFIVLIRYERLPKLFQRGLRFVPPAILAALIFPELVRPTGALSLSLSNHRLMAGLIATLVSWRTKNIWLTISAGMVVLWLLSSI